MANPARKKAEKLIYDYFDAVDKTKANGDYYRNLFSKMSDAQFKKFISKRFPYKFQNKPFVIEPSMSDAVDGLDVLGVPLLEKVYQPHLYRNKDGKPVASKKCMVVWVHAKKMKQFISKKNSMSVEIDERDMRTGLLVNFDKNGKTSDREFEALAIMGLDNTIEEFSRSRADSMKAKDLAYSTIATLGKVSKEDVPVDQDDSLSKNMLNVYMLGAGINSNLVNQDLYLPITIANRRNKVERET
jgi:hypothetical protein